MDQNCLPTLQEQYYSYIKNYSSKQLYSPINTKTKLNVFQPLKSYRICPIHRLTSSNYLMFLLEKIHKTTIYSIHTERTHQDGRVILIKIELRQVEEIENLVLVFEMLYLPGPNEQLFSAIKILLNNIFLPQHKIFVWNNNNIKDMNEFIYQQFLSSITFNNINIIELQQYFKKWYDRRYQQIDCQWTIESAINSIFKESIDSFNQATICPLYRMNYSVCYCLALSKLSIIIELDWTTAQLDQYKKFHRDIKIIS